MSQLIAILANCLIEVISQPILYYNIKTRGKLPGFIKDS